ncbi:hypothetical protein [uncultured Bacteroides sp.]|uniref:hypothetical protein n=1 Tax=uncultured Bacteroides sp. TaxID=162156 RepID=UPI0026137125|nr:hypothetical protein [uncultured Bacteroides sp.]
MKIEYKINKIKITEGLVYSRIKESTESYFKLIRKVLQYDGKTYKDNTGSLRSSMQYIILRNGTPINDESIKPYLDKPIDGAKYIVAIFIGPEIVEQFMQYPKMLRAIIKNYQYYLDNHKNGKLYRIHNGSAYNSMFAQLFCDNNIEEYESRITGGLFSEQAIDAKKFLEEYFKLLDCMKKDDE